MVIAQVPGDMEATALTILLPLFRLAKSAKRRALPTPLIVPISTTPAKVSVDFGGLHLSISNKFWTH